MLYGVYATYEEVKEYLTTTKDRDFHVKDDQKLKQFCIDATRSFDTYCKRTFLPRQETRYYDHPRGDSGARVYSTLYAREYASGYGNYPNVSSGYSDTTRLDLDDDLLEVVSLTTRNGETTITSGNYFLMTGDSYNHPPYDAIQLNLSGTQTTLEFSGTPQRANAVSGIWGYHEYYSSAWVQVDTVQDTITSSATTVTVADIDGDDDQGLTPRFLVQQLCRFGTGASAEMFYITGKNPETNVLDIKRGVNGTTAAQQTEDTAIYVYRPMDDIKLATLALSTFAYRRPGNIGNPEVDQPLATATGVMIMPSSLPVEVADKIKAFKRMS